MGKLLKAGCSCGYESSVVVGSGRELHGKVFKFPHLCTHCDEIVDADLLLPQITCPLCNRGSLEIYGKKECENAKKKSWFQALFTRKEERVETVISSYCYNLETTFVIEDRGYLCPKCKEQTLEFSVQALID